MTTIIITLLLISILYLIFAIKDLKDDVSDIEFRMDILKEICADYEKRIKELENVRQTEVKRRKGADKYSRVLETAISIAKLPESQRRKFLDEIPEELRDDMKRLVREYQDELRKEFKDITKNLAAE